MRRTEWTPDGLRAFVSKMAGHHDAGRLPFALHLPGGNEEQLIDIFADINEGDYYKKFGIDKPGVQLGVIAQELEEVLPNMVSTNPKTSKKTTNTDELIWHLVNAVKELSTENTAMKARLDALESA